MEAIPEAYERCVRNRPRATVVNCACVSDEYSEADRRDGVCRVDVHRPGCPFERRGGRGLGFTRRRTTAAQRYTCRVPARTLSAVLDEQGLRTIDLLSVDVEGYEVDVLKGVDLERFEPSYIVVEDSRGGDVDRYLTARGYRKLTVIGRGRLTVDLLYERNGRHGSGAARRHAVGRWRYLVRAEVRHLVAAVRRRRASARRT